MHPLLTFAPAQCVNPTAQEVYGAAIRVQPSKSAIHSNGLLRGDRAPGTEAVTAGLPATLQAASPSIPSPAAVAQHLAQAQHAMRPRPAGSTSSSERVTDMDEAPPGTTTAAEAEPESRRIGAAALMQHEWQPAGDAPQPDAAPASEAAPHPDPAQNSAAEGSDAATVYEEAAAALDADADVAALPDADGAAHDGEDGHAGANGFAEGHAQGMLSELLCKGTALSFLLSCTVRLVCLAAGEREDSAMAKRAPEDTALDEEQAVKRTKVL